MRLLRSFAAVGSMPNAPSVYDNCRFSSLHGRIVSGGSGESVENLFRQDEVELGQYDDCGWAMSRK